MSDESKVCKSCFKEKVLTDFYFRKESGGYKNVCKRCQIDGKTLKKSGIKLCKHCGVPKQKADFQKAGGGKWLQPYCKSCDSERKRKYVQNNIEKEKEKRKKYYSENRDAIRVKSKELYPTRKPRIDARAKRYREMNKEAINTRGREYGKVNKERISAHNKAKRAKNADYYKAKSKEIRDSRTPEQKEKLAAQQKEYRVKNKEKIKAQRIASADKIRAYNRIYGNRKSATDIEFRILKNLRSRTRFALKKWDTVKSDTTETLLGCTIPEFKDYFSSLFSDGMTWEAFMRGEIHIDHKIPCVKFNLRMPEEQSKCFCHTNLQPLWKLDNLKKGTSYT